MKEALERIIEIVDDVERRGHCLNEMNEIRQRAKAALERNKPAHVHVPGELVERGQFTDTYKCRDCGKNFLVND